MANGNYPLTIRSAISHQPLAMSVSPGQRYSGSEAIPLKAPVQCAAAETERLGGLAHVAVEASHRLLDQEALDFLEAHVLDARRLIAVDAQPQLAETNR